MERLGLEREIVDARARARTVARFRERGIVLPTFAQLARPETIPAAMRSELAGVDPDAPDPRNLFRVHWHNAADRRSLAPVPEHVTLPEALTGVPAPIVVVLGERFPLIRAHKVLAAYACLVPRIVTGAFDPTRQRAVWPSTGNFCRGGVAISRILGCRGVAVLPEGMSAERFRWLEGQVEKPADIVRTPGSESNVREIYAECARLEADPQNRVFNQFCEFGNHLAHYACTGTALERVFLALQAQRPDLRLAAFVSATGSAGTIGAGDHLKERTGALVVASEPLECPTMLYNGYGAHNIQGIGDKHVPLIHNVMNTDAVVAVSDRSTDALNVLFNTDAGRAWLESERGLAPEAIEALSFFGLSSLCNVLAAIQLALKEHLGARDAVLTVATDAAAMYASEVERTRAERFAAGFGPDEAAEVFGEHLERVSTEHCLLLGQRERERVFNLGYFTWVEQQGVSPEQFEARRSQEFWRGLRELLPVWDALISAFNLETGCER